MEALAAFGENRTRRMDDIKCDKGVPNGKGINRQDELGLASQRGVRSDNGEVL